VDDYLVKPADVEVLCSVIEKNLEQHTPIAHITPRKLWLVLREHKMEILGRWRQEITNPEATAAEAAEEEERAQYIGTLLDEIAERLEAHPSPLSRDGLKAATAHGEYRAENGATLAELLCEIRIFRQVLFRLIEQNLLAVNTSYVINDMTIISDALDQQLQASVEAFQKSAEKAA
jgi:hypothetical protein